MPLSIQSISIHEGSWGWISSSGVPPGLFLYSRFTTDWHPKVGSGKKQWCFETASMPQRTGVKQPLTEIFYPHKIQSPPQGAKASSPSRQGEWTTKPQPQPKQYDRQLNCIQASKRPSNQAKNTLPKHIQNRANPTAMGGIPNAFVIHRQREPVLVMSLKRIIITINLLHVICCRLGTHCRASIALRWIAPKIDTTSNICHLHVGDPESMGPHRLPSG